MEVGSEWSPDAGAMAMRMILTAAATVALSGCNRALIPEDAVFTCDDDIECITGYRCDPLRGICVLETDVSDSGVEQCGFEDRMLKADLDRWQYGGNTVYLEGAAALTTLESSVSGVMWTKERFYANKFAITMEFSIWGGGEGPNDGGDGMTIAWIEEDSLARGFSGGSLGVYRLNGYVVEIDTYQNVGDPREQHIAFVRATGAASQLDQEIIATATVASLRSETHHTLDLAFDPPSVEVWLDDAKVIETEITDYEPFDATFGATAATGGRVDQHSVFYYRLECD